VIDPYWSPYVHLFPEDTPDVSFMERLNAALPNILHSDK